MLSEPKSTPFQNPLRAYVESMLVEAGFRDLSPSMRADVTASLMQEAERRVGMELLRISDRRTIDDFAALAEGGASDAELAAFFAVRVPDLRERIKGALAEFAKECLKEAEAFNRGNG